VHIEGIAMRASAEPETLKDGGQPVRVSFAGHETFPLRYGWLPKAVRGVSQDREIFGREDSLVRLGVGKNMVRSIRHWGLACGMLEEDPLTPNGRGRVLRATDLGRLLLDPAGWDPFLEDPATLWLVQWHLASEPSKATTWFWVFNQMSQPEFTREDLLVWLQAFVKQNECSRVSAESLKRDIDCFIRTYVPSQPTRLAPFEDSLDCPLADLGLIREFGGKGAYVLAREAQASLPDDVFVYGLVSFLRAQKTTAKTVPLETVAFAHGGPGRVFCLSEESLMARLDRLSNTTSGQISFDETAGVRQLLIKTLPDPKQYLETYYARRSRPRRMEARAR
jgi:hypothetical protein